MKSDCCGAEPTNLIDMKCEECLEVTCFTEEFDDGDVITHIPMKYLCYVGSTKQTQ